MSYSSGRQRLRPEHEQPCVDALTAQGVHMRPAGAGEVDGKMEDACVRRHQTATIRSATVKRTLYRAVRGARHPRRAAERRRIRSEVAGFLGGRAALTAYAREVRTSGLMSTSSRRRASTRRRSAARGHSLGAIGYTEGVYLYAVLRQAAARGGGRDRRRQRVLDGLRPPRARQRTASGHLHSVDLPREVGRDYQDGDVLRRRGTCGHPVGVGAGLADPCGAEATAGRSCSAARQEELPPLLERLGTIDSFMHDSEHSFDCMWFEFNEAWPHLRQGGAPAVGRRQLDGGVSALRAGAGPPSRFAWPAGWRCSEVI